MKIVEIKDDFTDEMNLNEFLEYLINEIIICVLEIEYELEPNSKINLPINIEKEIKKNFKLAGIELLIANTLIIDDIYKTHYLDEKDLSIDKFKFLDEKEIIDGLRYITVEIVKVQTNKSNITEEAKNQVMQRLKTVYRYIENIHTLYHK